MTSRAGNGEGPKPKRRAETENGRMFFFFFWLQIDAASSAVATGGLARRFPAIYILLVGETYLSAEFQSAAAAAAAAWCSTLVSNE
jgi:polyferredoxin